MRTALVALVATVILTGVAFAHEGHDHKMMGFVSTIRDTRLELKGTDGKMSAIVLTDKTRIVRGTTPSTVADIKAGDRVVVTATEVKDKAGNSTMMAKEVRLGTATTPAATRK